MSLISFPLFTISTLIIKSTRVSIKIELVCIHQINSYCKYFKIIIYELSYRQLIFFLENHK